MTIEEIFLLNSRAMMRDQNISQAGLFRSTGMSKRHISGIFSGETSVTLKTIVRFAKVFGVEPWEMIK